MDFSVKQKAPAATPSAIVAPCSGGRCELALRAPRKPGDSDCCKAVGGSPGWFAFCITTPTWCQREKRMGARSVPAWCALQPSASRRRSGYRGGWPGLARDKSPRLLFLWCR